MQKDSIDLMNIEYEDVLHLYRGWRKSEAALKDKTKELEQVKSRVKHLQDSHVKFRNQIHSLESVKGLTINLQGQLAALQDENKQLVEENKELAQLNIRADELLKEKELQEEKQTKVLHNIQLDFATLKGRYEETLKGQKELEKLAADEQAMRLATEARLQASDENNEHYKEENRKLQHQLETASQRMNQCDQELLHASEQLKSLTREVADIQNTRENLSTKTAEVGLLKGDIARLLHLLEASPATSDYIGHWQDSGGMDFVGIGKDVSAVSHMNQSRSYNMLESSATDMQSAPSYAHLTAETSMLHTFDLTPAEFSHLKRVHGGDPFPMSSNLSEEAEYWVPSEAAQLGLQFLSARIPHASPKVIMDFLRSMNKIWLRRERRKLKRVKQVMQGQIEDLKRQLSQARPYKGVMADRQIKRLKKQVKQERSKTLKGRPKSSLDDSFVGDVYSTAGSSGKFHYLDQFDEGSPSHPSHERRLCKIANRAKGAQSADVDIVSTEKLLEASLVSLESLGKQYQRATVAGIVNEDTMYNSDYGERRESALLTSDTQNSSGTYPNDSYLRGALWIGRNLTVVSEELAEEMDTFRTKFISEVATASQDTDLRRCCHRLTLLANSGITQAHSLTSKSRNRTRDILQGASSIAPGDVKAFKRFLRTLPIESALTKSPSSPSGQSNFGRTTGSDSKLSNYDYSEMQSRYGATPGRNSYNTEGSGARGRLFTSTMT